MLRRSLGVLLGLSDLRRVLFLDLFEELLRLGVEFARDAAR